MTYSKWPRIKYQPLAGGPLRPSGPPSMHALADDIKIKRDAFVIDVAIATQQAQMNLPVDAKMAPWIIMYGQKCWPVCVHKNGRKLYTLQPILAIRDTLINMQKCTSDLRGFISSPEAKFDLDNWFVGMNDQNHRYALAYHTPRDVTDAHRGKQHVCVGYIFDITKIECDTSGVGPINQDYINARAHVLIETREMLVQTYRVPPRSATSP